MTSDLDIYRTASVLIKEHGEEADLVSRSKSGQLPGGRRHERLSRVAPSAEGHQGDLAGGARRGRPAI